MASSLLKHTDLELLLVPKEFSAWQRLQEDDTRSIEKKTGHTVHSRGLGELSEQSLIRWAGSKRKILPVLADFWTAKHTRYVEPFAGSAALFFHLRPAAALLGDLNQDLIDTYRVIREYPDTVHDLASRHSANARTYYRIRSWQPDTLDEIERAVRFIYLNRNCFNGIYRTNKRGNFNVPFGGKKLSQLPDVSTFRRCALLLSNAKLQACDFGTTLARTRKGDFVYIDPPYTTRSRRVFKSYGPKEFSFTDLDRLLGHLTRMHERGVDFVVSYDDCAEARELSQKWTTERISVRRHVAGFVSSRRSAKELLITNMR